MKVLHPLKRQELDRSAHISTNKCWLLDKKTTTFYYICALCVCVCIFFFPFFFFLEHFSRLWLIRGLYQTSKFVSEGNKFWEEKENKRTKAASADIGRQRVKQDPIVFSCIFCFWQMKNVNCPVCIWEFLHYSSASLVPAAPSPWQLPAPCSQHTRTHTRTHLLLFSDCVAAMVRWLTHSLTSEALVCKHELERARVCVCVYGSLIFKRHTMHTHACCLSRGCELLVAQHTHNLANTHI